MSSESYRLVVPESDLISYQQPLGTHPDATPFPEDGFIPQQRSSAENWREASLCRTVGRDEFFYGAQGSQSHSARIICSLCTV